MKKYSYLLTILIILSGSLYSQTAEQLYIEEHGGDPIAVNLEGPLGPSTWTQVAPAPNAYGRAISAAIGNYLYIFCSQNASSLALYYNVTTQQWGNSTVSPHPGYNCGYCVANGVLYKLGGSGSTTIFEKFTPAGDGTGTWSDLVGYTGAMGAENSLAWDGGDYIYVNAGTGSPNVFVRYKISDATWESTLAIPPIPRRYAGMTYVNGYIYRIGGLVETGGDFTLCSKYNVATNTWSAIAPLPEMVNFSKWSVTNDGIHPFIVGGGGGYSTYPHMQKCYYYTPETDTWTLDSDLPAPRGLASGNFLPTVRKLFLGGGNDGVGSTNYQVDTWEGTGGVYVPVELTNFTAENSKDGVIIKWSTATETNNRGFSIERSSDKLSWTEAAFISGKGNSTSASNYSFLDKSAGSLYYRLKQVDYSGAYSYSRIVEIDGYIPQGFALNQNYPNPFNPATTISYSIPFTQEVVIKVYDLLGREVSTLVNEVKEKGSYVINFESGSLASGTYLYKMSTGSFFSVKKMSVIK